MQILLYSLPFLLCKAALARVCPQGAIRLPLQAQDAAHTSLASAAVTAANASWSQLSLLTYFTALLELCPVCNASSGPCRRYSGRQHKDLQNCCGFDRVLCFLWQEQTLQPGASGRQLHATNRRHAATLMVATCRGLTNQALRSLIPLAALLSAA